MEVNTLKETLEGGYQGVYGEVVLADCYRLAQLDFFPDIIFDLGANVGVFSRYARSLFPKARIIAVEPHEENILHFKKFTQDKNTILVEAAIGNDAPIWHYLNSGNGSMQCYISEGLGYPSEGMAVLMESQTVEKVRCTTVTVETLINSYWKPGMQSIMKIDIEGGENSIFMDDNSVKMIAAMDYVAAEIHFYALNGEEHYKVTKKIIEFVERMEETHVCELTGNAFFATKRK